MVFFDKVQPQHAQIQKEQDLEDTANTYDDDTVYSTYSSTDSDDSAPSPYTVSTMLKGLQQDKLHMGLSSSDYLFIDEQKVKGKTSWGEKLCYNTGILYAAGLGLGGAWGLTEGLRSPIGNTMKLRVNSVLNSCTRRGPLLGNSAGIITMYYTTIDHLIGLARGGKDDLVNHVLAGGIGGALFKATSGVQAAGKSGLIMAGAALVCSTAYDYLFSNNKRH